MAVGHDRSGLLSGWNPVQVKRRGGAVIGHDQEMPLIRKIDDVDGVGLRIGADLDWTVPTGGIKSDCRACRTAGNSSILEHATKAARPVVVRKEHVRIARCEALRAEPERDAER